MEKRIEEQAEEIFFMDNDDYFDLHSHDEKNKQNFFEEKYDETNELLNKAEAELIATR